jgi:hypothetical protein
MKNLFCKFLCIIESFTRAKAATALTRVGNYEAAQHLMNEQEKCKC